MDICSWAYTDRQCSSKLRELLRTCRCSCASLPVNRPREPHEQDVTLQKRAAARGPDPLPKPVRRRNQGVEPPDTTRNEGITKKVSLLVRARNPKCDLPSPKKNLVRNGHQAFVERRDLHAERPIAAVSEEILRALKKLELVYAWSTRRS